MPPTTCLKNVDYFFFYSLQQLEAIFIILAHKIIILASKLTHNFSLHLSYVALLPENTFAIE